jgi:hypothetical protein
VNILVIATPHEDLLQEEEYGLSITSNTLQATEWKEEAAKNQQEYRITLCPSTREIAGV